MTTMSDEIFASPDKYANLIVALIVLCIFFIYYYYNLVRPPVLASSSTKFKSYLKESMPVLSEKYWPTMWCYGARVQTALANFLCMDFYLPYEREILKLEDGGEVALDWLHSENQCDPIVLILPGMSGCSHSPYIKRFAFNAHANNFRSVIFNYRGMGTHNLTTPKLYCISDTTDLAQVIQHIKNRYPNVPLGAAGTSMGSLILGNYLIKHSQLGHISVAMLNSVPYDAFTAADQTESGLNLMFNKYLTKKMIETVQKFKHILDIANKPWDVKEVMKSRTIREFDTNLTIKMFGYESLYEYYKEISLSDKMAKIKVPVLCLSSADDPCQPLQYSEDDDSPLFENDHVAVLLTANGGHNSYLEGLWPFQKKVTYMHRVFAQYFAAMFQNDSYKQFMVAEPCNLT